MHRKISEISDDDLSMAIAKARGWNPDNPAKQQWDLFGPFAIEIREAIRLLPEIKETRDGLTYCARLTFAPPEYLAKKVAGKWLVSLGESWLSHADTPERAISEAWYALWRMEDGMSRVESAIDAGTLDEDFNTLTINIGEQ